MLCWQISKNLILKKCALHCVSLISSWPNFSLWPDLTYLSMLMISTFFFLWPNTHADKSLGKAIMLTFVGDGFKCRVRKLKNNGGISVDIAEQIDWFKWLATLIVFWVGGMMYSFLSFLCGKWLFLYTGREYSMSVLFPVLWFRLFYIAKNQKKAGAIVRWHSPWSSFGNRGRQMLPKKEVVYFPPAH